ncbi:MAG TPA: regulatory protein RecX [Micromonosporaceae bacterium]|nr:regulatory protein RecX [Micromonosporaceae bacterium]
MSRPRRSSPAGDRSRAYRGRPAGETDRNVGSPDPAERAREICLRLLAVRPRTRAELATALRRRHIADEVAEAVLDRFGEVGMIDDTVFAEAWVTSRHHGRGLARRALGHELRRRGVDGATVSDALSRLDPVTEEQTARTLVERKLRTIADGAPDAVVRKLAGMLARKGYPPGLAFRVIREVLAEHPDVTCVMEQAGLDLDALSNTADAESANADIQERYDPDT